MNPELKIIFGSTPTDTKVFIDDKQIGLVQSVHIRVSIDSPQSEIEIELPDLFDPGMAAANKQLVASLQETLSLLSSIPYVRVKLRKLQFVDD